MMHSFDIAPPRIFFCTQVTQCSKYATVIYSESRRTNILAPVGESASYTISIPHGQDNLVACPVVGCEYQVKAHIKSKRYVMYRHFQQRHTNDALKIEEDGLLPRCQWCGFFCKTVVSVAHTESADLCMKMALKRRRYYRSQRQDHAKSVKFNVGEVEIKIVNNSDIWVGY